MQDQHKGEKDYSRATECLSEQVNNTKNRKREKARKEGSRLSPCTFFFERERKSLPVLCLKVHRQ